MASIAQAPRRRLFISYSRGGALEVAERLHHDLMASGFEVWRDLDSMTSGGRSFLEELREAIDRADYVLLLVEPNALDSPYVTGEWHHARNACKVIVPLLLAGVPDDIPGELRWLPWIDFREVGGYARALSQVLRTLAVEPPPLGPLYSVPALPPSFLPRNEEADRLADQVLRDARTPVVISSVKRPTALHGMGGVGKSVLASALARRCDIRRTFVDGIVWLGFGQGADVLKHVHGVARLFGEATAQLSGLGEAGAILDALLAERACLLIIDDIWSVHDAALFVNAIQASRSRLLLTTRNGDLATSLGAAEVALDILDDNAALELLAAWVAAPLASLPAEAPRLTQECGNLPLAIAVCGAMVRDGAPWDAVLAKVARGNDEFAARDLLNYPYRTVIGAFQSSLDFLTANDERAASLYLTLAAFPEDEAVPERVVVAFWRHAAGIAEHDARALVSHLHRRALVQLEESEAGRNVSVHDLLRDFLVTKAPKLSALHGTLVDAYREVCRNTWSDGPNDGYFFRRIAFHLQKAGLAAELYELAHDLRFLEHQARSTPDEPGITLRTVEAALQCAVEADNPVLIAEFMLGCAVRANTLAQESPLDALTSGNITRAWALADLNDATARVLWHRLLAWELSETGRTDDANRTAKRVETADRSALSPIQIRYLDALDARCGPATQPPDTDQRELRSAMRRILPNLPYHLSPPEDWDPLVPHSCFLEDSLANRKLVRYQSNKVHKEQCDSEVRRVYSGEVVTLESLPQAYTETNAELHAVVGTAICKTSGWNAAAPFFDRATEFANSLRRTTYDRTRRPLVLASVALELGRSQRTEASRRLFREALAAGNRLWMPKRDRASTVWTIACAMAAAGEAAVAIDAAMRLRDRYDRARVLLGIATTLTRPGDAPMRKGIARRLERLTHENPTLRALFGLELFLIGDREASKRVLSEAAKANRLLASSALVPAVIACAEEWGLAERSASDIEDDTSRCSATIAVAAIVATRLGGRSARRVLAGALRSESRDSLSRARIALAVASVGVAEAARGSRVNSVHTFSKAAELGATVRRNSARTKTLSSVIRRAIECGELETAATLTSAMTEPAVRVELLLETAQRASRPFRSKDSPSVREVLAALRAVDNPYRRDGLLKRAAIVAAERGDPDSAHSFCRKIEKRYSRVAPLFKTALAHFRAGNERRARSLLKKARFNRLLAGAFARDMLREEATAFVELGDESAAERLGNEFDATTHVGREERRALWTHINGAVAIKLAREGHVDQVMDRLQPIRSPGSALQTIAKQQAKLGNFEMAHQLAREIYWISVKADAFGELAIVAAQAGNEEECKACFRMAEFCTAGCSGARPTREVEQLRTEVRELGVFIPRDEEAEEQRTARAISEARAGHAAAALELVRQEWLHPERYLPLVAAELFANCGKAALKLLLPMAARNLDVAVNFCPILSSCYPEAAAAIVNALVRTSAAEQTEP